MTKDGILYTYARVKFHVFHRGAPCERPQLPCVRTPDEYIWVINYF